MNNKIGLTEEQQLELLKLVQLATRVARLTTESVVGTNEAIASELDGLLRFVRTTYPRGPLHLEGVSWMT